VTDQEADRETGRDKIRVLIVDDHQIVRHGLRTFLELHDDVTVVGEAADGAAAVEMTARFAPDVVLMDVVMPNVDGITATRRISELGGGASVIVLTSFAEDDQIFPAIEAGAVSYLLKDVSPDDLVAAVRAAHRDEPRLHPDVARKLMAATRSARTAATGGAGSGGAGASAGAGGGGAAGAATDAVAGAARGAPPPPDDLTEREVEVVRLVARGRSNREIAEALWISEKTVKTHVSHALTKLGLKDRTQLAIHAIKSGLADVE
jgi:two-component system, NarL family, response regulator LiaR